MVLLKKGVNELTSFTEMLQIVPLYLVKVQIYPLKADPCLVAHRDEHRIWVLKLRTLCSLRRHQNKPDISTFNHLHFKCANHLTDTLICSDR